MKTQKTKKSEQATTVELYPMHAQTQADSEFLHSEESTPFLMPFIQVAHLLMQNFSQGFSLRDFYINANCFDLPAFEVERLWTKYTRLMISKGRLKEIQQSVYDYPLFVPLR